MRVEHQHIEYVTLLVRDCDEAKAYCCDVLGFELVEECAVVGGAVVGGEALGSARLLGLAKRDSGWRELQILSKKSASAIKQEDEYFSSCIPTILGATIRRCRPGE